MPHALAANMPFYLKCSVADTRNLGGMLWFRDILQTLFTPFDSHRTEDSVREHIKIYGDPCSVADLTLCMCSYCSQQIL